MSINSDNNNAAPVSQAPDSAQAPAETLNAPSSDRFAILARKEKAMRDRVRQIEEQERAFRQREQELQSTYVPKDKLTKDPLAVLSELGIPYDKITEQALAQQNPWEANVRAMKDEIASLRQMLETTQKTQQEQQTTQYQNAIKQIQHDVSQLVESNPDFELIKNMGAADQVVELIEHTYKTEGRVLNTTEAAKIIEDYLFENTLKAAKLSKITKALTPAQAAAQEAKGTQPAPTLTHTQTVAPSKPMSEKDRIARAIAAFSQARG